MSVVTISRGTFSGGQTLADCVAGRLGYSCVSREELVESTKWYGLSDANLAAARDVRSDLWRGVHAEKQAYLMSIRAALIDRASTGNLVYHGHAAHLLLPEVSHLIRIRAIADMPYRVEAAMQAQKIGKDEARAFIESVDRERAEWSRFLYEVEWDDPSHYDIVLNLSHLSLDSACEIVVATAQLDQFRPTKRSIKAMADLALSNRVGAELATHSRTRDEDLRVDADDGVVTITSATADRRLIDYAASLVRQTEGVLEVRWQTPSPLEISPTEMYLPEAS